MDAAGPSPLQSPTRRRRSVTDDWAYMIPMFTFLAFTQIGASWPSLYVASYVAKTGVVALLLWYFWNQFTRISWSFWWAGVLVGVLGIVQWVGMQLFLQQFEFFKPPPADKLFDPIAKFGDGTWQLYAWLTIRWIAGATLVVPIMEELFWRDFCWRSIAAPNDFKMEPVGSPDWKCMVGVSVIFAVVHGNWWLTSIVWAFMIAGLLVTTRSIGACIIAHGVTNFLLGFYVLRYRDWAFW